MRYDIEGIVKSRLYIEYEEKNFRKGMTAVEFREYIHQMIKYVEDNFSKFYAEELKKQEVSQND